MNWGALTEHVAHRPWPLPEQPWIMTMSWMDLLFAHWSVPARALRAAIPDLLDLDLFAGDAWLSVVPFRMEHVAPRGITLPPGLSAFPELNVRTYVSHRGRPGVWFFSLDATSLPAIAGARAAFHLPYFRADMDLRRQGDWYCYQSRRRVDGGTFRGNYHPTQPSTAAPGSLEHWLTERYCLYSADNTGRVYRGDIHHQPWPLRNAMVEIETNTVADRLGLALSPTPDAAHFAQRLDVIGWPLELV